MATLQATRKKALTAAEWQEAVRSLAAQVTEWSRAEGWTVERLEARVLEGYPYPPALVIQAPQGRLMLDLPDPQEYAVLRPDFTPGPPITKSGWNRKGRRKAGKSGPTPAFRSAAPGARRRS